MVMLFQGWSHRVSKKSEANPWFGNVYNMANNVNGIDGDLDIAYVGKKAIGDFQHHAVIADLGIGRGAGQGGGAVPVVGQGQPGAARPGRSAQGRG